MRIEMLLLELKQAVANVVEVCSLSTDSGNDAIILSFLMCVPLSSLIHHHPKRTMSLVSLGSCFFTMCGMNAFKSSTMGWDAARVSAAVPSGVGFLGAGLIWKGTTSDSDGTGNGNGTTKRQEVHGLATAAGVWLSAALGVGVGGKLYVPSTYAVVLVIYVLRLAAPRVYSDESDGWSDDMAGWESETGSKRDDDLDMDDDDDDDDDGGANGDRDFQTSSRSTVTQEERKWLMERESTLLGSKSGAPYEYQALHTIASTEDDDKGDEVQTVAAAAFHLSTHSLPVERTSTSNNNISQDQLSPRDGSFYRVHSSPHLGDMARQDYMISADPNVNEYTTLRRIKSEAEFLVPVRDERKKSRSRKPRSSHRNKQYPIYRD